MRKCCTGWTGREIPLDPSYQSLFRYVAVIFRHSTFIEYILKIKANFYEFPLQDPNAPIRYRDFVSRLEQKKGLDTTERIKEMEEEKKNKKEEEE